jgi:hypothetical protein
MDTEVFAPAASAEAVGLKGRAGCYVGRGGPSVWIVKALQADESHADVNFRGFGLTFLTGCVLFSCLSASTSTKAGSLPPEPGLQVPRRRCL